jgi:ActR/RegA family two-component response regulator
MAEAFLLTGASPQDAARASRRRLLLVDDDLSVAKFLAHAAEECGLEAVITVSAESFRSQYQALVPEVVVLDLALPGSDGVELLRFLAEARSRARIMLVSGFDERVLEAAMRLGAAMGLRMASPLHKPVRLNRLMAVMLGEEVEDDPCLD